MIGLRLRARYAANTARNRSRSNWPREDRSQSGVCADRPRSSGGAAALPRAVLSDCGSLVVCKSRTGRPYHQEEIQKRYIRRAAAAAAIQGKVGWHTFRHSYRSWLDDVGASVAVQKELMRHASITTTTNLYGTVVSERKREANSNVVQMIVAMQESAVDQCRAG